MPEETVGDPSFQLWKLHAAERVVELGDPYLLARIRDLGLPEAFASGQSEFGEIADLGVSVRAHAVAHEHRIGDAADAVHESRLRTFLARHFLAGEHNGAGA